MPEYQQELRWSSCMKSHCRAFQDNNLWLGKLGPKNNFRPTYHCFSFSKGILLEYLHLDSQSHRKFLHLGHEKIVVDTFPKWVNEFKKSITSEHMIKRVR